MRLHTDITAEELNSTLSKLLYGSMSVYAVDPSAYSQNIVASLNPNVQKLSTLPGDSLLCKGRIEKRQSSPDAKPISRQVYAGIVRGDAGYSRGEISGSLWTNFPIDKKFSPKRKYAAATLSFVAQVLLESIPHGNISNSLLFEEYVKRRYSFRNEKEQRRKEMTLYTPFFEKNFNVEKYKAFVLSGDKSYPDNDISQVTKNFAFCILSDITEAGSMELTKKDQEFLSGQYAKLTRLLDIWENDIGVSRASYSNVVTTNKLLESIHKGFSALGIEVGNPPTLKVAPQMESINEVDDEGKEFKQFSNSDMYAATEVMGQLADEKMAAVTFLSNALLLAKGVMNTSLEKTVPTVFPNKRLDISKDAHADVLSKLPECIKDASWISYESALILSTGQYYTHNTKFKQAGKILNGGARWQDKSISRYVFTYGDDKNVLGKVMLNPEHMTYVRANLHPTYEYNGKYYRYLFCERGKDGGFYWLEVDKDGRSLGTTHIFSKEVHEQIRDNNPELTGKNTRGVVNLYSDLKKALSKQARFSPVIDGYLNNMADLDNPAIGSVVQSVNNNFVDTIRTDSISGLAENLETILHRSYNDLVAPFGDSKSPYSLSLTEETFKKDLTSAYSTMLDVKAVTDKMFKIGDILTNNVNMKDPTLTEKDKALGDALLKQDPVACALRSASLELQQALTSEGIAIGPNMNLKQLANAISDVELHSPKAIRSFRQALKDYYGDISQEVKVPVFNTKEGSIGLLPAGEAVQSLVDMTITGVKRELGVLSSIAMSQPLSDRPISFSKAAEALPPEILDLHLNIRKGAAMGGLDQYQGKAMVPYTPFVTFGTNLEFKQLCQKSQSAHMEDIKTLASMLPKRESATVVPKVNTQAHMLSQPIIPDDPVAASRLGMLIDAINHGSIGMQSVARDSLAGVCIYAMVSSGDKGPELKKLQAAYDLDMDSYAFKSGESLAKEYNNPEGLLKALRDSGVVDHIVHNLEELEQSHDYQTSPSR